jgi:hypothetical protein
MMALFFVVGSCWTTPMKRAGSSSSRCGVLNVPTYVTGASSM